MTDTSNTANTINAALQDPVPVIGPSTDPVVQLLRGYMGEKTAIVREMTGADEEYLSSLESRSALPYPEYVSALLKRTVVSIGNIQVKKTPEVIDDLIVADRDLLFLGVVKATYGSVREYHLTCPHCSDSIDMSVNIDEDFPLQGTEEDAIKPVAVVLKSGDEILFDLPKGSDAKYVGKKGKTLAEQNTLMISRCANVTHHDKEAWARSLNIADRNKIVSAILDVKIGPKPGEVNDPCPHCGEQIILPLDWVSLLFG